MGRKSVSKFTTSPNVIQFDELSDSASLESDVRGICSYLLSILFRLCCKWFSGHTTKEPKVSYELDWVGSDATEERKRADLDKLGIIDWIQENERRRATIYSKPNFGGAEGTGGKVGRVSIYPTIPKQSIIEHHHPRPINEEPSISKNTGNSGNVLRFDMGINDESGGRAKNGEPIPIKRTDEKPTVRGDPYGVCTTDEFSMDREITLYEQLIEFIIIRALKD